MREKEVESYLREQVKKQGGRALKFVSPGNAGVPDRLVILPGGKVLFVELKGDGGRLSPLQNYWLNVLNALGVAAFVCWSREDVDNLLEPYKAVDY